MKIMSRKRAMLIVLACAAVGFCTYGLADLANEWQGITLVSTHSRHAEQATKYNSWGKYIGKPIIAATKADGAR